MDTPNPREQVAREIEAAWWTAPRNTPLDAMDRDALEDVLAIVRYGLSNSDYYIPATT